MSNPYVFIVGCPRSGTTLLQRMVNAHPNIAVIPETHWVTRIFKDGIGLTAKGLVTPDLIPRLVEHPGFAPLEILRGEVEDLWENLQPVTYSRFVTGIFDLYGKAQGKSLVGDKTPPYVRHMITLHKLWPQARFVHLIRDGRDVCLSMADWPKAHQKRPGAFPTWEQDPIATTALWWELNVQAGLQAGSVLGPELYFEQRYESLVKQPGEACAALCSFLGLPYDEAMLRFHEGRTSTAAGLSTKDAWLPVTPGLRDWRKQMLIEDVERFEAAVGELLDELGYERTSRSPRPESFANAARIRQLLAQTPCWIHHTKRCQKLRNMTVQAMCKTLSATGAD